MSTDNNTPPPEARRARARRATGMSFSSGGLSDSSSGSSVAGDDIDDIETIGADTAPSLNDRVRGAVPPPRAIQPNQDDSMVGASRDLQNAEEFTPRARLAQVGGRASEYEREYRMQLLHRMLMRNLPLDEIAAQLGVSISTVMRDRTELTSRLREVAKGLDVESLIGNSKGFYEEVQAMAMRAASNSNTPMPMRLAAMRTALASHNDMHRFFQASGVYDVLRFRKTAGNGAQSDIQRLMMLTEDLLTEARRPASEDPLGEFSGGDSEVMDL